MFYLQPIFQVCEECKEEFCTGNCIVFQYDSYQVKVKQIQCSIVFIQKRLVKEIDEDGENNNEGEGRKKKKRAKSARKKKS